jgi:hypothetical protein
VTDARTGESEKKLFTFTSKNGANKFVPVSAIRPLKNYARTQKHDPSTTRTHENASTNNPQCQPRNSLEDHASMDVAPATTNENNAGSDDPLGLNNINTDTIGNSTEEASMKMVIDAPLSPNSQQLLDSIKSTINQENTFGSMEASDYVLNFEETSLEFFTGIENPQDEGNSTSQDEGYSTSGSTSGKSSPTSSFGEDQPSDNMEILQTENGLSATDASATVPEENIFVQEANIDPALEDLSTAADLFDNNSMENLMVMNVDNQDTAGGHSQTLDLGAIMQDSSNIQFVVVDGDSTAVAGQEFTLIGTYDNYPEMVQANPSLSSEKEKVGGKSSQKEPRRHTKGPKKADLSEIPEQNRQNVLRCRKYRVNKNIKVANWEDELKSLETRNEELKEQEKDMMERLAKVQGAYINLIKAGRIKCV